jgi:hypothetical protein
MFNQFTSIANSQSSQALSIFTRLSRQRLVSVAKLRSMPIGAKDRPKGKHAFPVEAPVPPGFSVWPISNLPPPYSGLHSKLRSLPMTISTTFSAMRADVIAGRTIENLDRALPRQPDCAKSSDKGVTAPVTGPARCSVESADDYSHVVVLLDAKTRVIAADIQWIIQRRINGGRYPWQSQYYFRSKAGLLFYAKSDAPELQRLPDWFPERRAP